MNKKIKALVAVGGTGGHVFPGYNLANHLSNSNYNVKLVTDRRGLKFIKDLRDLKVFVLPSSPFIKKNILSIFYSTLLIIYSVFRSIIFLIQQKPNIVFGMGGYASFPICVAAYILKIKFICYENNLVIGRANKILLPFAEKVLVSYNEVEGIQKKYLKKVIEIGNIIKEEIINLSDNFRKPESIKKLNLLILGGSQAAKVFAESLPNIFRKCTNYGISLKIYQHCLPDQNEMLKLFYEKHKIDYEIFNFSYNLIEYFSQTNLAITRSGSSMLAELTNANIPFISVPLPSSADNHQLKNAIFYERKKCSFLIEEKDLNDKLFYLIKEIYENNSKLDEIIKQQRQFSDKKVYENINKVLKDLNDEKN